MNEMKSPSHGFPKPGLGPVEGLEEVERPSDFKPDLGFDLPEIEVDGVNRAPSRDGLVFDGNVAVVSDELGYDGPVSMPPVLEKAVTERLRGVPRVDEPPHTIPDAANADLYEQVGVAVSQTAAATDSAQVEPEPESTPKKDRRASAKKDGAVGKDLQKLRRVDLLELLVDQIRENDRLISENERLADSNERLKAKLDQKDGQIDHLKRRLSAKDEEISHLEERNRNLAHASGLIDVSELIAVEEAAVDRYLKQLRQQGIVSDADSLPQL